MSSHWLILPSLPLCRVLLSKFLPRSVPSRMWCKARLGCRLLASDLAQLWSRASIFSCRRQAVTRWSYLAFVACRGSTLPVKVITTTIKGVLLSLTSTPLPCGRSSIPAIQRLHRLDATDDLGIVVNNLTGAWMGGRGGCRATACSAQASNHSHGEIRRPEDGCDRAKTKTTCQKLENWEAENGFNCSLPLFFLVKT
jgi:hypothetical protein